MPWSLAQSWSCGAVLRSKFAVDLESTSLRLFALSRIRDVEENGRDCGGASLWFEGVALVGKIEGECEVCNSSSGGAPQFRAVSALRGGHLVATLETSSQRALVFVRIPCL